MLKIFIICIVSFLYTPSIAQKTFHVSKYDTSLFKLIHSSLQLKEKLYPPGKYLVLDFREITKRRIWNLFYIDKNGKLIDKKEYCCAIEEMDLKKKGQDRYRQVLLGFKCIYYE